MSTDTMHDVTRLLQAWSGGRPDASAQWQPSPDQNRYVSEKMIPRDWRFANLWLHRAIEKAGV